MVCEPFEKSRTHSSIYDGTSYEKSKQHLLNGVIYAHKKVDLRYLTECRVCPGVEYNMVIKFQAEISHLQPKKMA